MDPMLVLEIEECRRNEMCESRVFNMWEGKQFFQMQAYADKTKYTNLLWSCEVLAFGPAADKMTAKSGVSSAVLQQTLAQTLAQKTIAFQKKSNLDSIDLANSYIEKTVIPRVLFGVEKFSPDGGLQYRNGISLTDVSVTRFKGKYLTSGAGAFDLVVLKYRDFS